MIQSIGRTIQSAMSWPTMDIAELARSLAGPFNDDYNQLHSCYQCHGSPMGKVYVNTPWPAVCFDVDNEVMYLKQDLKLNHSSWFQATPGFVNDPVFDNLIHYWSMDEASGTRSDSKGSIDLVEIGGPVASGTGLNGNCVSISSSNFLDSVSPVFPGIGLASSLMVWFKAPALASLDVWNSGQTGGSNDGSPFVSLSANQMVPGNSGDGGGALDYNYTANTWHLVVLTSTDAGVQSCSFDGAAVTLSDNIGQSFSAACQIGMNRSSGTVLIDEAGVFNVALNDSQCATLWNGGIGKFYRP